MMRARSLLAVSLGLVLAGAVARPARGDDGAEFFEKKVRPVLAEHCYKCHSGQAKAVKGGLRVDSRAAMLTGGDSGPALVPGEPDRSKLVEAVRYGNPDLLMPPKSKLPPAAVADLAAWVKMGAPWPADGAGGKVSKEALDLEGRKKSHWAWGPVKPQVPPAVQDGAWPLGPVDRFVLAKLEAAGLRPAEGADRATLLRRASFDLVGLPPTADELREFVDDPRPDAYERAVERLLSSPRFGERWARHWLDLVRYAESRGHEFDYPIPNAPHYRDYVVRALNDDVPYDVFVVEHLAGDLVRPARRHQVEGFNESILGTGFWHLGEEVHSPVDIRQDQADRFDNRIDVFTKTFLGLTVACARCHDHKFDALTQKDYYALFGLVAGAGYRQVRFDTVEEHRETAARLAKLREAALPAVRRGMAEAVRPGLEQVPAYLLAAREALLRSIAAGDAGRLAEVARPRGLDAGRLAGWVAALGQAEQPGDPLYLWAKVVRERGAEEPKRLAEVLRAAAEVLEQREQAADAALTKARVVFNFGAATGEDWRPDDAAFGTGPAWVGDVRLRGAGAKPAVRLVERRAAEYDRAFDGLTTAPGTENDPGALGGGPPRAGRTIRTPTFALQTGKLWYLVRGGGMAFASLGDHVMVAGPLHGRVVLRFPDAPDYRWVGHDLSAYKGYQGHVEFTAAPGTDFAVALVVEADAPPGAVDRPLSGLKELAGAGAGASPEALAAGYGRWLGEVVRRLGEDGPDPAAEETARLGNWLLGRAELFGAGDTVAAVADLAAKEEAVRGSMRTASRLAPALLDGSGVEESVFLRGSPRNLGEKAPRRFLEALAGPGPLPSPRGSGRLELARQVVDPERNPFLARVLVNRVWHHLFGRGLVASVDNFGVLGEPPTHPELLDWLAEQFVREGWSVKSLVRQLVLSRTYRMASRGPQAAEQADPQDLLLHRMRVRRLEGEAIRDALLAVSGRLDSRMYGPAVPIYLTPFLEGRGRPASGPLDGAGRRSLYLGVRRNFLAPFLLAFDTPSPFSTVGKRSVSNVPAQALILLNDPFVHQQAGVWARRVLARPGTAEERVRGMYLDAFGRPPTGDEEQACLGFVAGRAEDVGAWAELAHTLVNVKEFVYVR